MLARRYLWILLSVMSAAAALAQAPVRLLDNMEDPSLYIPAQPELGHKWTGSVTLDTTDPREGAGCLRFDIQSARSGRESYPQFGRSLDPATNDWTGYRTLRYWVKVVSADPKVTHKAM